MTAHVLERTPDELHEWRHKVETAVGSTLEELEEREGNQSLSEAESNALATLRGIDFLLSAS